MDALQRTSTFNSSLIQPQSSVIIGLSGGPDSVYLLHRLHELKDSLGLSLVAAHLDHEWRDSSKVDAVFCADLCQQFAIPLITKRASELSKTFVLNGSQEELGRNMRRFFLETVRQEHNASAIVLAHHQDDQLETFFINLIRGTTIAGLCGMKEQEGYYIRPLLGVTKEKILAYLTEHNIPYCIDPTNVSDAYLRNRIRSTVIPALSACDDRAHKNVPRALKNIHETERFLTALTQQHLEEVETDSCINLKRFFTLDPYLQKRVLFLWLSRSTTGTTRSSEAFLEEVLRFLTSPRGGTHQISPEWRLSKKQGLATLQRM